MISWKKKFIFIHIPKTGGNSIQNLLYAYSDDEIVVENELQDGKERFEVRYPNTSLHKHSSLYDYWRVFGNRLDSLYKFVTIRNPWDRAISYYFSPHRGMVEWDKKCFINFVSSKICPIRHFLQLVPDEDDFISRLDYVIKFESLNYDFMQVGKKLQLGHSPLPHRNKSTRKHYTYYYDKELVEFISELFLEDIQLGNYSYK